MDFEKPLAAIDHGFAQLLESWPSSLRVQLSRLDARIWPSNACQHASPLHRFNNLTRLYPFMQIDGVLEYSARQIESALVGHACLVLYAYVTDKADDGQIIFDTEDTRVASRLYRDAMHMLGQLRTIGPSGFDPRNVFLEIDAYDSAGEIGEVEAAMINAADLSARLGFFATLSLLAYAGQQRCALLNAARAYRHTVVALQYIDDMLDWREDMTIGDNNLLLGAIADRGFRIPDPSANEWEQLNVAHALLRFDAINVASIRARTHLHRAIGIQKDLGCALLQEQLFSIVREIEILAPELHRRIENEVLVGFLITSATTRKSHR